MWLGPFSAFLSSVTWAIGSTGYSRLSRKHSAFSINFCRALISLPLFVLTALLAGRGLSAFERVNLHHWTWYGISMIASYGLGDTLFLWSTLSLGVPAALALASCYPIWTALFGLFFRGEVMTGIQVTGLLIAIAGMVTVILNKPQGSSPAVPAPPESAGAIQGVSKKGVALALITSFLWALNGASIAQAGQDVSPAVGNAIRMFLALGIIAVVRRFFRAREPLLLPKSDLKPYLWVFLVEAYGGSMTFVYGMSHSPLALGAVLSALAPVISVPVAWAAGMERFSMLRTLGIGLVVTGLCLLLT